MKMSAPNLTAQTVNMLHPEVQKMVFEEVVKLLKPQQSGKSTQ